MACFGPFIRRQRESQQKSMKDLAEFMDTSIVHVSDLKLGHRSPTVQEVRKISEFPRLFFAKLEACWSDMDEDTAGRTLRILESVA